MYHLFVHYFTSDFQVHLFITDMIGGGGGGGPTLLMSVHSLILAKCSQNRQTKIDKNRQK